MSDFYTNVQIHGSRILYRGVENGRKVRRKVDYFPTFFVPAKQKTEWTTIHGDYVAELKPGNIRDARDFIKQYEDVDGFVVYGNNNYQYSFIAETFPDDVEWDLQHINVTNIDIEVGSENGFPEPASASEPITAITFKNKNKFVVLGCGKFENKRDDVWYIQCRDEVDLLKKFLDEWTFDYPDIITGWNVKFFDIPYLVNRITKVLGESEAKRLSPWMYLDERRVTMMGREQIAFVPSGISVLDYIELYKKFAPGGQSQESYKLDAICNVELGERKLSYEEYGSLHTKFIDGINESIVRSEEDSSVGHHSVGSYSRANMLAPDFFRESDQVLTFVALCYVQC